MVCDDGVKKLVSRAVRSETARLGGAAMMTEGLACDFSNPTAAKECHSVMAELDAHAFSYTDYGDSQGAAWAPSAAQQEAWARTHARAVAGVPTNMSFDPTSKAFAFCFSLDAAVAAPTEIFASTTYSYPHGRNVTTTPNLRAADADDDADLVLVTRAPSAVEAGPEGAAEEGCVWIQPK